MSSSSNNKIVLVTGANKGIGFEVIRLLASSHPDWTLLLGSRSLSNAEAAIQKLPETARVNVHPIIIDVNDDKSISSAADQVKDKYDRVDYLIDNAAVAIFTPGFSSTVATIRTNVTGVQKVDSAFLPIMPNNTSRIIHVTSEVGSWAHHVAPKALRETIESTHTLTWSQIESLLRSYEISTTAPTYPGAENFPDQRMAFGSYGTSKMFMSAYGRMLDHQLKPRGIPVMLVSPGYCATDLNHNSGPRSAEMGGKSVIMALNREVTQSSKLFIDDEEQPMATQMADYAAAMIAPQPTTVTEAATAAAAAGSN